MAEQFLNRDDRQKLARVIEGIYDLQLGPAARFSLLDRAGLRRFVPGMDLAQSPGVLAGVLISRLEPFGMLPGDPSQPALHALGALVNYIREQNDTPQDDARFLAELLVKYQLVADTAFLDRLSAQYGLNVAAVRQVDPALLPPAQAPQPADEPAFDPAVGDQTELEQIVNSEDNFLDIDALAGAIYTAQAVGRIELPRGRAHGTGFLIGPDLMLTNYHVFKSKDVLTSAVVRFDYHANADGVVTQGRVYEFQPDFYVGSPDKELDFALVRLKGEPLAERKMEPGDEGLGYLELLRRGRHRGYLLVSPSLIVEHERVNIIQHPNGNPQKVVLTQNYVLANMTDTRVHYLADTLPGSSGSPVLNRYWEVIALHHSGGAHPPQKASNDLQRVLKGVYKFNEGIPIRAILPKIERYLPRK
ncbi:trypsin-like peptidase domain-containing protein [Promineifilum sp.]|uniref:trypsin-like peptidase domain-containing protein n=1 Tax=Promineifilum sp. TaxID=2664178 RepID=UPI0035B0598A